MLDPQILAFTGVAALLTITPGADTLLVMRSVLARGQRAGLLTTLGICTGCLLHAAFSALGLSLILMRSAAAYEAVKWLGAGYLVYLGVQSLRGAWRNAAGNALAEQSAKLPPLPPTPTAPRRAFLEGLLTNLFNPKVAIFYLAFLPQFLSPGDPVLAKSMLLALIHAVLGVTWLSLITLFLGRMRLLLERPRVKRSIEAAAGTMLILFGLRLALEKR